MHDQSFKISPSFYYLLLALGLSLCVIASIWYCTFSCLYQTIATLGIVGYSLYYMRRFCLLHHPHSILALHYSPQGEWHIILNNKIAYVAQLCGDSTVTPLVCVLRFKVPKKWQKINCVLFKDALAKDEYRKLIVLTKTLAMARL